MDYWSMGSALEDPFCIEIFPSSGRGKTCKWQSQKWSKKSSWVFDVKDAYKNCRMRPEDLWQQVYLVGGKYFLDLGGMFGSRNAGDAWNLVMEFIVQCIRHHCKALSFDICG